MKILHASDLLKRFSVLSLLCLTAVCTFAGQRNLKDLENLFKGLNDVEAYQNAASFEPENFLKTILISESTPGFNEIEANLLKEYSLVALMSNMPGKPFNCYFVKDSEGKRGIVGLDGKVIVPPLSGLIVNIPVGKDFGILLIGEVSRDTPTKVLHDWAAYTREYGIVGLFSAIVTNADKPNIKSLFPLEEYIFMSLGSKGNGKFDIFTLKPVGDDALWGIVDIKGKTVLPNEYTGFIRKGHILDKNNTGLWGKWVGTTEMDMTEALNYSRDLKADTKRRRQEIAAALNSFGNSMIDAGQTIQDMQEAAAALNDDADSDETSGGKGGKKAGGKKYSLSEQEAYNSDKHTYSNYDSMLSQAFAGNRSASASEIKEWQSKMKKLREKWEKKGKSFPHSANEDR